MVTAINLESGKTNWKKLELFRKTFFSKWRLDIILNAACRHLQLLCEKFDNRVFSSVTVLTSSLQSCIYVAAKNDFFQTQSTSVKGLMVGAVTWKIWFTEISITIMRNHSWNPPPSPLLLKGRGRTFQKLGRTKFLARKGG